MTQGVAEIRAGWPEPQLAKEDVEELVGRLREWSSDPDARIALCKEAAALLFRWFVARGVRPVDAEDLSHDVVLGLLKACSATGLNLTHGADSFYRYLYTSAERRLIRHRSDSRRRPLPVESPGDYETGLGPRDLHYTQPAELIRWIRDTTRTIPDDLQLLLLVESGVSHDQLSGMRNWTKARVADRLHRARRKVAGRLAARHVAETRWPHPDRSPEDDICLRLRADLTIDGREWDPRDPYGFTDRVYRRILDHAGGEKPRCAPCAVALAEAKRDALMRRWLATVLVVAPAGLIERVRLTAAQHGADGPLSWAPPAPGPRGPAALGATIVGIGAVIWALMGDPPSSGLLSPEALAPPRPGPSTGSARLGAPPPGSPAATSSSGLTTPARQPGSPSSAPPVPASATPTPTIPVPPVPPTSVPPPTDPTSTPPTDPTDGPSTDPTDGPSADPTDGPSTDTTDGPSTDPTDRPPTLEVGLAAAVGVCAPAYRCDSTPGVAPTSFEGDCSQGVAVNFRATVTVSSRPAKVTVRWIVDGSPRRNVHLEFPASGPESQFVSRTFVIRDPSSSGSQIASIEARDPVTAGPARAEATVVCT
ncbi:sigma-70 family RNA polymerase sigma factor [Actinoplanes solisilvae]|uniref:sigma-70 family RNA polymerase sigma factor n=1 Tax=Actinoplanes solisilvae TaxID=2486853 RepID=UPI000FD7F9EA|nr:sigma-70 family RNA polymerase sigma factor [Actinoplanes solisilvae]